MSPNYDNWKQTDAHEERLAKWEAEKEPTIKLHLIQACEIAGVDLREDLYEQILEKASEKW